MNRNTQYPGSESDHSEIHIVGIETYISPYDYWHDRYQAYYREGLRSVAEEEGADFRVISLSRFPRALPGMRRIRNSSRLGRFPGSRFIQKAIDHSAVLIGGNRLPPSGTFHPLVGQYVFHLSTGQSYRVCVDASDGGDIASQELLNSHDLYFKTNYWSDRPYPPKVRPFFNGNPLLLPHLSMIKTLRNTQYEYDFCFVVRVWGGSDETEGIEHNIRLLEAAAKVPAKKLLLAYLVAGDTELLSHRLHAQGIPTISSPMPLGELWQIAAKSRLNIIRLGMHACLPWRMADMLAIGCCPVLDQLPKTVWPEPLQEGAHYLSLGVDTPPGTWLAEDSAYAAIPDKLAEYVHDAERSSKIRARCAQYFDDHFEPEAVARWLCRVVREHSIVN